MCSKQNHLEQLFVGKDKIVIYSVCIQVSLKDFRPRKTSAHLDARDKSFPVLADPGSTGLVCLSAEDYEGSIMFGLFDLFGLTLLMFLL